MNLEFREAHSEEELRALFDLRRNVYSQDESMQNIIHGSDISGFDLRALHFGAFDDGRAVAYMRMVQKEETIFAPWVRNIAGNDMVIIPPAVRFPFEMYCPYKGWNHEFIYNLAGKKIGEAGRLAIHEDYRKDGVLENFILAFIEYCTDTHDFDTGFGVCTFALERFYRHLGFKRADRAKPFIHGDLPEAVMLRFDGPYANSKVRHSFMDSLRYACQASN